MHLHLYFKGPWGGKSLSPSLSADELLLKAAQIATTDSFKLSKIVLWCPPKNCSSPVKYSHPQTSKV